MFDRLIPTISMILLIILQIMGMIIIKEIDFESILIILLAITIIVYANSKCKTDEENETKK